VPWPSRSALLIGLCLTAAPLFADTGTPSTKHEEGRPLIRAYGPAELGGDNQNWAMGQDARGVIYVGSQAGVLEFDGAFWRLIETPRLDTVRSLAIDDSGRVYVGSVGDFGYLAPDAAGRLRYVTLTDKIPAGTPPFADIWRTFVTPDGVVFEGPEIMFRWANGQMHVITPASRFNRASVVDGKVYLSTPENGLNVLEGDTLKPLPGTEALEREVYPMILRYDERRLLIGTRLNGLFLYDGAAMTAFPTELDPIIKRSLYRGIVLRDGSFALATTNAGLGIVDRQGHTRLVLDQDHGLTSNAVYYLMVDREGALWATLERGIVRIETPSATSFFDKTDGYEGAFNTIRFAGRLYLAQGSGVSYLHDADRTNPERLSFVTSLRNQCWWFQAMTDPVSGKSALPVACSDGLFEIRGTAAVPIRAPGDGTYSPAVLLRSRVDPTRLWIGMFRGFASFRWVNGQWIDEGVVPNVTNEVRTLVENPDGSVWLGTGSSGLGLATFASRPQSGEPRPAAAIESFGAAQGLPPGGVGVASLAGEPLFTAGANGSQLFRFDAKARRFVRDHTFDAIGFDRLQQGFGLIEGPGGVAYANFGRGTAVIRKTAEGSWTVDKTLFSRFGEVPTGPVLAEPDGIAWFGTLNDLYRFDMTPRSSAPPPYPALVRRVTAGQDDPFFWGDASMAAPRLPPSTRSLRFEFAAPTFLDETATQYQTMLEGLDRDWSPWTRESRRDFTNLGLGDYRFHVRARNIAGQTSEEGVYGFTMLPPWYRTWPAYGGFLVLLGLAGYGTDRLQRWRLLAKERERAQVSEARLRAEAAEALAQSEREGKRNVEALSGIGREITSSLDFDTIFDRLYERVNELADADVFGVGLYHPDRKEIEYRLAIENGTRYAPYTRDASDPDQLPVWCIEHREPVFLNDVETEYSKYIRKYDEQRRRLEDGSMSRHPQSIIYMPLVSKDRTLGIVTIQSFEKNAYTDHHLNVMQSLASYASIALDNAAAYQKMNEQEHEIRRLFEEAEHARAVAEEADAAKSAFLSTVSHELRTPLTSVLGFAKIIKKRLDDRIFPLIQTDDRRVQQTMQQVEENLKVVVSEGERLTKLIDDVLDLAKIEAGKLEWHMEPVTVPEIVDRATAATASLFDQKGLALRTDVSPDLPGITGDRDRLIQVVINLISNAVKFTPSGSITCRAVRRGGEVVVSVIDTGVGITPADQPKVFERFKQVGDTLTDKPKGTGLGLPICREIVEHHGGRVWVESEIGKGSTFSFSLPVTGEASTGTPIELAALIRQFRERVVVSAPRITERRPRILVVDDEANIRELLTQEFTEAGYQVATAGDGRAAIASIRAERPDLVVLDVMMPEMSGFDVAAVLKNDPQTLDIPIMILSIVQDRERGIRLGVDRYLTKPIDTDLLFREVGTLLEQRTSRKRVLVVDEDATTIRTLTDVLTARGYHVSDARSADLVEKAKHLQPDIIMLNSVSSTSPEVVQMLRFEKGLENVLFLVYQ